MVKSSGSLYGPIKCKIVLAVTRNCKYEIMHVQETQLSSYSVPKGIANLDRHRFWQQGPS